MSNASSSVRGGTGKDRRVSDTRCSASYSETGKILVDRRRTPLSLHALTNKQSSSVKTLAGNRRGRSSRMIRTFSPCVLKTSLYHACRLVVGVLLENTVQD